MKLLHLFLLFTLPPIILLLPLFTLTSLHHPSSTTTTTLLQTQDHFSLLISIFTLPDHYSHRHFLRLLYPTPFSSPSSTIHLNFIFCNLSKPDQHLLIPLEILRHNDIIILNNCTENMNSGKTYTFFSSLPHILPHPYDYIMKADDDVFFQLPNLAASLLPLPRRDLYYGFVIPCTSKDPFKDYMSGMGYVLSWDLVEWISVSEIPAGEVVGPEDKLVGKWLKVGGKGKNRYSEKPGMYDYPGSNGKCSHELIPATVAVHRLKRREQWLHVLSFFNVTTQLQPSKLYHL
ncbi:Glycosyl transferase family 31 protein [Dioscorea alata]|uniref:Glycosyl transferase family 31 protein n=1 Tax=Dioscorea alata TaxID=55571 RepID=A0ACB7V7I2_DIOAL|nr:Glycosyl transferase family 31 protein [Dioscorea alata]